MSVPIKKTNVYYKKLWYINKLMSKKIKQQSKN